jgi:hypothetical protein
MLNSDLVGNRVTFCPSHASRHRGPRVPRSFPLPYYLVKQTLLVFENCIPFVDVGGAVRVSPYAIVNYY